MTRSMILVLALGLFAASVPVHAQTARRTGTLSTRPAAQAARPTHHGHPVLHHDGSILVHDGHGGQRVIPSCAVYAPDGWARGDIGPAPQMGTNQPVPGAKGLPPAPGLSPVPGLSPPPGSKPTPGLSSPASATRGSAGHTSSSSTLQPLHSGWRTAGATYLPGVCYVRDAHGQLHLIYL